MRSGDAEVGHADHPGRDRLAGALHGFQPHPQLRRCVGESPEQGRGGGFGHEPAGVASVDRACEPPGGVAAGGVAEPVGRQPGQRARRLRIAAADQDQAGDLVCGEPCQQQAAAGRTIVAGGVAVDRNDGPVAWWQRDLLMEQWHRYRVGGTHRRLDAHHRRFRLADVGRADAVERHERVQELGAVERARRPVLDRRENGCGSVGPIFRRSLIRVPGDEPARFRGGRPERDREQDRGTAKPLERIGHRDVRSCGPLAKGNAGASLRSIIDPLVCRFKAAWRLVNPRSCRASRRGRGANSRWP